MKNWKGFETNQVWPDGGAFAAFGDTGESNRKFGLCRRLLGRYLN